MKHSLIKLTLFTVLFITAVQTSYSQDSTSTKSYQVKSEDLKDYVGIYVSDSTGYFNIKISLDGGNKLMAQPTDKSNPNTLMLAVKKDLFNLRGTPLTAQFHRNDEGEIISIKLTGDNDGFTATKKIE